VFTVENGVKHKKSLKFNRLERAFSALFRPLSVVLDITG
jgi:hypothetical protein